MPRRKIQRTPEEEAKLKKVRREKNIAQQKLRRQKRRVDQMVNLRGHRIDLDIPIQHSVKQPTIKDSAVCSEWIPLQAKRMSMVSGIVNTNIGNTGPRLERSERSIAEHYIGPMDMICCHCNAKHFAFERTSGKKDSFQSCCGHGAVRLESLPEPPGILRELFDGKHEKSNHFLQHIRSYNNSFAFASFNANLVNFDERRPGPYCFKINGQIYYQINTSLYPSESECPSYGQLFIVDQNEATDVRCNQMSTLDAELVGEIDSALRKCNDFARSYQMMHEELLQSRLNSRESGVEPKMQLLFSLKPGMDRGRYNLQKINEVAAIFTTTADGEIPESYVSIRVKATKELTYISTMDPNVEPWIYPLFYPNGTRGWHDKMPLTNRSGRVTRNAYTKYRMADRDDNVILKGGRLFQQWIVDSHVKVERDRLTFDRNNQEKLRSDSYQGLRDHLQRRADESHGRVGKMVILPSSFVGSPRNMMQHYQDAMSIVRKFGKPDLFITMTCNPNWREIQENLLPAQTPSDRPDLVSRVFHRKKDELMEKTIIKDKLFGEVLEYVYVVEYQKRGLPHVHILLTLKQNHKITTPDVVDKYISAEIPNPDEDPTLHQIVMKNMIHGPCGSWCKNEKGHDAAAVEITDPGYGENVIDHDEIRNFVEARYVSPVEASDRILSHILQEKSHSIVRLPVHLPNQQTLTISDVADDEAIRSALQKETMLMDYFTLNQRDPEARKFTYSEIPSHYVFKKNRDSGISRWEKRKAQFNVIGRMYSVAPTQIELFHLRLLLIKSNGAISFEDLRTVNGHLYDTYLSTCLALGLIADDTEWERAMTDGEIWMMPRQLRRLYARILIYCQPNQPEELWLKFKDAMSQDFQRDADVQTAERRAYAEINTFLTQEGSDLSRFPTMPTMEEVPNNITESIDAGMLQQHTEIGLDQYRRLNVKQKEIVDKIFDVVSSEVNNSSNTCFYIDGPGGSGKTFIYTTIYHILTGRGKQICTMAFTGIAAILLPHGRTVHKTFGMPVPLFSHSVSNIKNQSQNADYLRGVDVFIWDEAPMAPRYALELVDRTLRDFTNVNLPFGGKIMILGGDFRQLLPVKTHATRSEMVNLSIKFSVLWKHFSIFALTENMRTLPGEIEFSRYLLSVGDGCSTDASNNLLAPEQCIAPRTADIVVSTCKELIEKRKFDEFANVAILSARNIDVEEINNRVVEHFDKTTEKIYTSIDSVKNCDNGDISDAILPEYLNSLSPPVSMKDCVQILELANNLLRCRILTGDKAGEIVFIHRIILYCEDVYPFTFQRRKFPIKLAFAMTINKSQGQTFNRIELDLRKDVFNHGVISLELDMRVAIIPLNTWTVTYTYFLSAFRNDCLDYGGSIYTNVELHVINSVSVSFQLSSINQNWIGNSLNYGNRFRICSGPQYISKCSLSTSYCGDISIIISRRQLFIECPRAGARGSVS
ncbi:uncharacterized protein LOC135171800 [Diachasmimorpha longicaudata]|uniref:uncharacterized protein LOC135171800 n=1 Tax=Diachasmimorpha longicaudata TaxID=58733 RepID=UPI0030B8A86A